MTGSFRDDEPDDEKPGSPRPLEAGKPLHLTDADIPARIEEIDALKSEVIVENPHATNEPNLRGTPGAVDGKDEGQFTMTLDQFLCNFDGLRHATVMH